MSRSCGCKATCDYAMIIEVEMTMTTTRRNEFNPGLVEALWRDRGRQSDAFRAGWRAMERAACDVIAESWTVADLRAAGGWTVVLTQAFVDAVGDATVPGSFKTTMPVRTLLTPYDIQTVKNDAIGGLR